MSNLTQSSVRKLPPLSPNSDAPGEKSAAAKPKKKRRTNDITQNDSKTTRPKKIPNVSKQTENTRPDMTAKTSERKKPAANGSQASLISVENEDSGKGTAQRTKKVTRKTKKKRRTKRRDDEGNYPIGEGYLDLTGVDDDIIASNQPSGEEEDEEIEVKDLPSTTGPMLRSQPVGKLFIEQRSGFKSTDKGKLAKRIAEQQLELEKEDEVEPLNYTTIQFGIATHRVLKTFSLFCHGILAGFGLWQFVIVFVLTSHRNGYTDFLDHYNPVSLPVQCTYYFLLVLCTVSVLDRYDIAHPTRKMIIRAVTLQSGAVAILFYMLSLILSLSVANIDDKIGLYGLKSSLWDNQEERQVNIDTWKIINLLRGLFAILGWLVISIRPGTDRLVKNLESAENIMGEPVELTNVQSSRT